MALSAAALTVCHAFGGLTIDWRFDWMTTVERHPGAVGNSEALNDVRIVGLLISGEELPTDQVGQQRPPARGAPVDQRECAAVLVTQHFG